MSINYKTLFEVKTEPTIFIIGRRETGKTVLSCDILYHYTKTQENNGTVITSTDRDVYRETIPNSVQKTFIIFYTHL